MGRRILSGVVRRCADVGVHIAGLAQTARLLQPGLSIMQGGAVGVASP
jgi:hypothetical protein